MTYPHDNVVLAQAVQLVVDSQFGSVDMLVRRLGLGFLAASHLMDRMADLGVVGPHRDGPRDVLVTREALPRLLAGRT